PLKQERIRLVIRAPQHLLDALRPAPVVDPGRRDDPLLLGVDEVLEEHPGPAAVLRQEGIGPEVALRRLEPLEAVKAARIARHIAAAAQRNVPERHEIAAERPT